MNIARVAVLFTGLSLIASGAHADDPATPATQTGMHPSHPLVRLILAHEQELKLTADQVTRLTALEETPVKPHPHLDAKKASATTGAGTGTGTATPTQPHHELPAKIKAILTPDQQAEVLKLIEAHHHGHGNHGKHAGATGTGTATK